MEKPIFQRLLDKIGQSHSDNILGTFSLEYAECRGNLNKEQAFFYLALYQFAVSRQFLLKTYLTATTEKHPDLLRLRHLEQIKSDFSYFSTPYVPKVLTKLEEEIKETSKPYKILNSFYAIDDFKENLPHSSAYLVLQLSEDKQQLYYGMMQVTKERKLNYYISKLTLSDVMRDKLFQMIDQLAQSKIALQKTPITIEEDLEHLERDAEEEINKLMEDLEIFFEPLTTSLYEMINPVLKNEEEEVQ